MVHLSSNTLFAFISNHCIFPLYFKKGENHNLISFTGLECNNEIGITALKYFYIFKHLYKYN